MIVPRALLLFALLTATALAWDPKACRNAYAGVQCLPDRAPTHLHAKPGARLHPLWRPGGKVKKKQTAPPAVEPVTELPPIAASPLQTPLEWSHRNPESIRGQLTAAAAGMPAIAAKLSVTAKLSETARRRARAEYEAIIDEAERADASPDPIGTEAREEIHNEMMERAIQHYLAEGVNLYALWQQGTNRVYAFIEPTGDHPMNRQVKAMAAERPNARVALFQTPDMQGAANFVRQTELITLGPRAALGADPDNLSFRHERRHLWNSGDPERDFGYLEAKRGRTLPKSGLDLYSQIQGNDEMDTYAHSLRDLFDQMRYATRMKDIPVFDRAMNEAVEKTIIGAEVSNRTLRSAEQALAHFAAGKAISYEKDAAGRIEAVITMRGSGGLYDLRIPLPGGSLEAPGNNRTILETRLKLLRDIARNHVAQFEGLQRAIDRIPACRTRNSLRAVTEALRGTIRLWTPKNYEPITQADTVERFNRLVDRHWARLASEPDSAVTMSLGP